MIPARPSLLLLVALLAALPSLLALGLYGVFEPPDAAGYLAYAAQVRSHSVPVGHDLLYGAAGRISLFRIGGYPALLAGLQSLAPGQWRWLLVVLQIAAQSAVAAASYAAAGRLGATRWPALAAAVLPAFGYVLVMNICVLTDSLNAAAITGAALALLLRPDWRGAALAGLLLGVSESFREATVYLVFAYLPLALLARPRWLCALLVLVPVWAVVAAQVAWNVARGAGPVLTTSKQLVMVMALLPLFKQHLPVYNDDPVFAAAAQGTLDQDRDGEIDRFWDRLYAQGYTPVSIAAEAAHEYGTAWRRFPLPMLEMTLQNFRYDNLFMPFEPQKAAAMLSFYENGHRPDFDRLGTQWRAFMHGDMAAGLWLLLSEILGIFGMAISLAGLIAPWRRRGTWRERAVWCIPMALAAIYMPVHLEARYLVPAVPLVTVLAAAGVRAFPFKKT